MYFCVDDVKSFEVESPYPYFGSLTRSCQTFSVRPCSIQPDADVRPDLEPRRRPLDRGPQDRPRPDIPGAPADAVRLDRHRDHSILLLHA